MWDASTNFGMIGYLYDVRLMNGIETIYYQLNENTGPKTVYSSLLDTTMEDCSGS